MGSIEFWLLVGLLSPMLLAGGLYAGLRLIGERLYSGKLRFHDDPLPPKPAWPMAAAVSTMAHRQDCLERAS